MFRSLISKTKLLPTTAAQGPISSRLIHSSVPTFAFRRRVEEDIRYLLDSLPPSLYVNPDGTTREPTDLEFHKLAQLSLLAQRRKLSVFDFFTLSEEEAAVYSQNYKDILKLLPNASNGARGDIVDKIPYESKDGGIEWKVVYAKADDEGWEKLSYYYLVPALVLLVGISIFKDDDGINAWAEKELKLRALGTDDVQVLSNEGKSKEEIKKRDDLIVERILSGEYDKLSTLQTKLDPTFIGDLGELSRED